MAVRDITQLKKWFKKGAYPTESQFADLIDSFRHKNDKVGLTEVQGLTDALNKKYDTSEGKLLEAEVTKHTAQIDWLNTVQERQAEEIDELEETDEAQQVEINTARNDIITISNILNNGGSLDETKAALEALGNNYAGLYALAVTVKTFLETTDTKETTINTWQEIEEFLQGITDTESLAGLLAELEANITEAYTAAISEAMDSGVKMVDIEYSRLIELRDNGELTPGSYYRITDYETTVANDDVAQCAGHPFDLIVKAHGINTLSEEAMAIQSERDVDGYFSASKLEAWKIWYCLDNDIYRFVWADPDNGKGVIYRMIDDRGNDCPYDFKNIMFKRYLCGGNFFDKNDSFCDEDGNPYYHNRYLLGNGERDWIANDDANIVDHSDIDWFYTFSLVDQGRNIADATISDSFRTYRNVIMQAQTRTESDERVYIAQFLNDIVLTAYSDYCVGESYSSICGNYFDRDCCCITIHGGSQSNKFGCLCRWVGGYSLINNTLGCDCEDIVFGHGCTNNVFGNSCSTIALGLCCENNRFGRYCNNNYLEVGCVTNVFEYCTQSCFLGACCVGNIFSEACDNNTLGSDCRHNEFGCGSSGNVLDCDCENNSFGIYCNNNNIGYASSGNELGCFSSQNFIGTSCVGNIIGPNCFENIISEGCKCNILNDECRGNVLGEFCKGNVFRYGCVDNNLGSECNNNIFNQECSVNILAGNVYGNELGTCCHDNQFSAMCSGNTIGPYCRHNTFNTYFRGNHLKQNVQYCTFGDYIENISVGNNVMYIDVAGGDRASAPLTLLHILNGVHGISGDLLQISPALSGYCQYVGVSSSGVLKIWNPADLIS
ncbi:MAG: hypothetical protein K2I18_08170 [Paramuribaculum sp.]|nr:hypothetical protein [Paramuribaculum sp.]